MSNQPEHICKQAYDVLFSIIGRRENVKITYKLVSKSDAKPDAKAS